MDVSRTARANNLPMAVWSGTAWETSREIDRFPFYLARLIVRLGVKDDTQSNCENARKFISLFPKCASLYGMLCVSRTFHIRSHADIKNRTNVAPCEMAREQLHPAARMIDSNDVSRKLANRWFTTLLRAPYELSIVLLNWLLPTWYVIFKVWHVAFRIDTLIDCWNLHT